MTRGHPDVSIWTASGKTGQYQEYELKDTSEPWNGMVKLNVSFTMITVTTFNFTWRLYLICQFNNASILVLYDIKSCLDSDNNKEECNQWPEQFQPD